jgi:hypothetical protein
LPVNLSRFAVIGKPRKHTIRKEAVCFNGGLTLKGVFRWQLVIQSKGYFNNVRMLFAVHRSSIRRAVFNSIITMMIIPAPYKDLNKPIKMYVKWPIVPTPNSGNSFIE